MSKNGPIKSIYFSLAVFIWLFLGTNCSQESHPYHLSVGEEDLAVYDSCRDRRFVWNGRDLQIGPYISRTKKGNSVYELQSGGRVADDLVLKAINDTSYDDLKVFLNEEIQLAIDMPTFYTATNLHRVYKISRKGAQYSFAGFLVKQRVNGPTLGRLAAGEPDDPVFDQVELQEALRALLQFRSDFAEELKKLNEKDIFIWDLHHNNIMYDRYQKKWLVVDANRDIGFDKFLNEIKHAPPGHVDLIARQHFLMRWPVERDDVKFFEEYLDIYFGSSLKKLQILTGLTTLKL